MTELPPDGFEEGHAGNELPPDGFEEANHPGNVFLQTIGQAAMSAMQPLLDQAKPLSLSSGNSARDAFDAALQSVASPGRIQATASAGASELGGNMAERAAQPGFMGQVAQGLSTSNPLLAAALAIGNRATGGSLPVPAAAATGMATQMATDPATYLGAIQKLPNQIPLLGPVENKLSPAETASGVPFTRAEISQNPSALEMQGLVQGSPVGQVAMGPFKARQSSAIDALQQGLQNQFGSSQPAVITGNTMRDSYIQEQAVNQALSKALYANVPKDARVPVPGLMQKFQELGDELPDSINKIVTKHTSAGTPVSDVTGSGDFRGVTQFDSSIKTTPRPNIGEFQGVSQQQTFSPNYGVGYSASPNPAHTVNTTVDLGNLMTLRSKLSAIQEKGGIDGMYATQLKQAINNDIESLASSNNPLGQMLGQDVKDTLGRATNYYREMKQLQDHPVAQALKNARIEDLPDILFKGGRTQDVLVGRAALGDAGFSAAQKSFFTDLLNKKDIGKELSKYDPEFIKQALTPQQQQSLLLLDAIKKRAASAGKVEPMAGSSKTNMTLALLHGLATAPIRTAVTGLGAPWAIARTLTNPGQISANIGPLSNISPAILGLQQGPNQ